MENRKAAEYATPIQNSPGGQARADAGVTRVCCGNVVEPRLAEIRDRFGQSLFAAVWHCPACGRVTF